MDFRRDNYVHVCSLNYKFKIEARNNYGYSDFSDEVTIICATVPEVPSPPTTSNVNEFVQIDWVPPVSNGLPITSY